MTALDLSPPAALPASVAEGPDPAVLDALRRDGAALAIWRRAPDAGLADWLDALPADRLPALRAPVTPSTVAAAVSQACAAAGTPEAPDRARLIADVAALAARFAALMRTEDLHLRLDVVDTDACRRFHLDRITARLLCTYRGTGTDYGEAGPEGTAPRTIHRVPRMAPALVRGALWDGARGPVILHRSPPIEGTGQTRLLLVLDPA